MNEINVQALAQQLKTLMSNYKSETACFTILKKFTTLENPNEK